MIASGQLLAQLGRCPVEGVRARQVRHVEEASLAGQLAKLVYTLRVEAGVMQTELARRMGSTQSSIARIEAGGNTPTLGLLDRLGNALLTLTFAGQAVTFGAPAA